MKFWSSTLNIRSYVAIGAFFMMIFWWFWQIVPQRVGDGMEYYALFFAWADSLRPWMSEESFRAYQTFFLKSSVIGLYPRDFLESAFPSLHLGGTSDFNHFWFYSFLAFLSSKLLPGLDLHNEPHKSYLILHFLLLFLTASCSFRLFQMRGLVAFLIMTVTSPIIWYFDKVHTELFTYCTVLISIMLMLRDRPSPCSFALSLAATQNPSFAIIALAPFSYRFVFLRKLKFSTTETMLAIGVALLVLMHPVYYFFRYGVPTPQLLAGGAELGNNLSSFYIWLIDPDVGLLPNWPAGILSLMILTYWVTNNRPSVQSLLKKKATFFYLIYFAVNFYAHASTTNINSGATPGLARYSLWYLPIFFPIILIILDKTKICYNVYGGLLMIGLTLLNATICWPTNPENYTTPSVTSHFIQKYFPSLYNPPHEVFAERYSGFGEEIHALNPKGIVGPDCKKVLVFPANGSTLVTTPKECLLNNTLILKKVETLDISFNKSPVYSHLPD